MASISHATVIVAESFFTGGTNEYVAGALNNQAPSAAGTGWSSAWTPASAGTRFVAAQASDLGLYSDGTNTITRAQTGGSAGSALTSGASSNDGTRRSFNVVSSGDLYFSFSFSGDFGNENTSYGLGSDPDSAFNSAYLLGRDNTDDSVVLRYNNNAQTFDTGFSSTSATFFVARITDIATTSGTFSVWINPSQLDNLANETPDGTIAITGTSLQANHFSARYFGADVGNVIDDLRIGTDFFSVTGVTQIPEPTSAALLLGSLAILLRRKRA